MEQLMEQQAQKRSSTCTATTEPTEAQVIHAITAWMQGKHRWNWLVSTYVVCERLSVIHEPVGVVEILVQILQNTPYSEEYPLPLPPPPKIEI